MTPAPTVTPTAVATPADGDLTDLGSIIARVPLARGSGNKDLEVIRDRDMPPPGTHEARRQYDTNDGRNVADEDWIGYAFDAPETFGHVRFQEGVHFARGGWFSRLTVHVRKNGVWTPVTALNVNPPYPGYDDGRSFEIYELTFAPTTGDAIRIWGLPGGKDEFISVGELRVYSSEGSPGPVATATAAVPVATATPTATRTATPVPTVTASVRPSVAPSAQPTAHPTATAVAATPVPTAVASPEPSLCGNGVRDPNEQCDGADAESCPTTCLGDCRCAASFTFPLDGWTPVKGSETRGVVARDADQSRVLVLEGDIATGALAYPERASLDLPFPILSFTGRFSAGSRLQVSARATNGRAYVLNYAAVDGVPLAGRRQATFPIGARGKLKTTLRDLRADLAAAFHVELAAVTQVTLRGGMRVSEIVVASPGVLPADPTPDTEITLPAGGWSQRGFGTVVENEYDAELAAPTLRTEPRDPKRGRIAVTFPAKDALAADYRTFSLVVRDAQNLALEVRVRTTKGVARLRYAGAVDVPVERGRNTVLPLLTSAIDGSGYRLVSIDLAADVARVVPGATLEGVLRIRLQGKFRVGDVVLREPM